MKKQNGITLMALTITIVVMLIIAGISAYFGSDLIKEMKLQDLRTNMLLIQAKSKDWVEEVNFQTANLNAEKPEDLQQINTIKAEYLKGVPLKDSEAEEEATSVGAITKDISEYYYLDETILEEMGIKGLNPDNYGYFIVRYDIQNTKVDVINTMGYEGKYTLEAIDEALKEQ